MTKAYKAAAIVFVIVNSISLLQALLCIFFVLGMSTGALGIADANALMIKSAMLLYAVLYFSLSAYSVAGGALILMQRNRGLWMSSAIVSIIAGLFGMIMILLHLPAAIWLIRVLKKSRVELTGGELVQ